MNTRQATPADIVPGVIIRLMFADGTSAPWSDCLITDVDNSTVTLSRPRAFLLNGEYTLSAEVFQTPITRLLDTPGWHIVCLASGKPENHSY